MTVVHVWSMCDDTTMVLLLLCRTPSRVKDWKSVRGGTVSRVTDRLVGDALVLAQALGVHLLANHSPRLSTEVWIE